MNLVNLPQLFSDHLTKMSERLWVAIDGMGYDHIVISSGRKDYYFSDDQSTSFERTPHFVQWCPAQGEGHLLVLTRGEKPKLVFFGADDFWHEPPSIEGFWVEFFDILCIKDLKSRFDSLASLKNAAFIGPDKDVSNSMASNPESLVKVMDWLRSYKTPWEVEMLRKANRIGARGHKAAEACFLAGGSEFDVYVSYLAAVKQTDDDLPYGMIIGMNEHAGFLHYEAKEHGTRGSVLLLDAGARVEGYGSDITRTFVGEPQGKTRKGRAVSQYGLDSFKSILRDVEALQLNICSKVSKGLSYVELHKSACLMISKILEDHQLVAPLGEDERVRLAAARAFFPHGLGHMLGIQVHDVAGHQLNLCGKMFDLNQDFPSLRNYRVIEEGHVFTIEPGLYFIPMLLEELKFKAPVVKLNWKLIDELLPCGGIRIEDNIYVSEGRVENLTRSAFQNF